MNENMDDRIFDMENDGLFDELTGDLDHEQDLDCDKAFDKDFDEVPKDKKKHRDTGKLSKDDSDDFNSTEDDIQEDGEEDFLGLWKAAKATQDDRKFDDDNSGEGRNRSIYSESFAQSMEKLIQGTDDVKQVNIKIASPEDIKKMSYGEVLNSETLNYRTLKAEFEGLFCERIFGPMKSFECHCGTQFPYSTKETVCEKCRVPIEHSSVRRERMGHILLPTPVVNPLFINYIHLFLHVSSVNICKIINFELYIVISPGLTRLEYKKLLTEQEYHTYKKTLGENSFVAETGSEAIYKILKNIDLQETKIELEQQLLTKMIEIKKRKLINLLRYITSFIRNKTRPEYMIFTNLPVLPAGLRPLVQLESGKFVSSDLNDKYRAVVYRKNRLEIFTKKLSFIAPEEIINNEKRLTAQSIVKLIVGDNKNSVQKSVFDILQGKPGLLRNKMLGKRNDFTARAVITVSHKLKIDECGIPKKILKELFRPFLYRLLLKYALAISMGSAKHLVDIEIPEIWWLLDIILEYTYVLLNRAPTLYCLGIQAFKIKMIDGNAIQIPPLVCKAFNADFDGDQMSIHVPLFLEAQLEAREIMSARKNILSPVSGKTIIGPTKDMVLGLYSMTLADPKADKTIENLSCFASLNEIEQALSNKDIHLNQYIYARYDYLDENGKIAHKMAVTNAGRMRIWAYMPRHIKFPFETINRAITRDVATHILDDVHLYCGDNATITLAEAFQDLGFESAFKSGVTIGRNFVGKIEGLDQIREKAWEQYIKYEDQYGNHLITKEDKTSKIVIATNKYVNEANKAIENWLRNNPFAPVSQIINSGARGSVEQLRQMVAFRGLGLNMQEEVDSNICIGNYNEGLKPREGYGGAHGARKGAKDKSVSISTGGYLQRKMVDVSQNCIVNEKDCKTQDSIRYGNVISGGSLQSSLADNIAGRVLAEDIVSPVDNSIIVAKGTLIDPNILRVLKKHKVHQTRVRSPVFCKNNLGVCSMCYGVDTSTGKLVESGKAVGIVAAQSIGEPGSQMIMKSFQSGNVAKGSIQETILHSGFAGIIKLEGETLPKEDYLLVTSGYGVIQVNDKYNKEICKYFIPYGSRLFVKDNDTIEEGSLLSEIDDVYENIFAINEGFVKYENLILKVNYEERTYEDVGIKELIVIDNHDPKYNSVIPSLLIVDENGNPKYNANGRIERHYLNNEMIILVEDGEEVKPGTFLCRMRIDSSISDDIVDGLTKVVTILEARHSGEIATLAPEDGIVQIDVEERNKWKVSIINKDGVIVYNSLHVKQQIKRLLVRCGDRIKRGDMIVSGTPSLQDILNINGVEGVVHNFIHSVQAIYKDQGVPLSNQHLEILLKRMLSLVEVTNVGDSHLIMNDYYDVDLIHNINKKIQEFQGQPITYKHMIIGITQAAIRNPSFLSAASFQETQKTFTNAALRGAKDYLHCLKSNIICSKILPIGTGKAYYTMQKNAEEFKKKKKLMEA